MSCRIDEAKMSFEITLPLWLIWLVAGTTACVLIGVCVAVALVWVDQMWGRERPYDIERENNGPE